MRIPFYKMHGASNDFILVDDRAQTFPCTRPDWLASIMNRRTGVGSDGTILIQPSESADFRMRFFNPDGSEVEMCGNGARCVARLAADLGAAPASMSIETIAGLLRAECRGENILLHLTEPTGLRLNAPLDLPGGSRPCHFLNTGVPHAILPVQGLEQIDVQTLGSATRFHPAFAPAGTNANFMERAGPDAIRVRTYERGVEGETLACGTGITASAITACLAGWVTRPVRVQARSGDWLTVDFRQDGEKLTGVTLLGPAMHVFKGELNFPE